MSGKDQRVENKRRSRLPCNNSRIKTRKECLEYYGGECACCGCKTYEFLAIDHIHGNGKKHVIEIANKNLCRWLKTNNFPDGFRILCHNCNMAKGMKKNNYKCPHEK